MAAVNKVILVGNLGRDPETHGVADNPVVQLAIATTERWKDKDGNPQEKTEWHRVTAFGRLAEICREFLQKGSLVYVEGSLRTTSYEKDGEKKYVTDIVMRNLQMLGGRPPEQNQRAPAANEPASQPAAKEFDDDIPF